MATVGYQTIGANTYSAGTGNGRANPAGLLITMPTAGTITTITAHVAMSSTSKSLTCSVYLGSAGSLGALQATSNTAVVTSSFAWIDFTLGTPFVAAATTYWLEFSGYGGDGPGTTTGLLKYDTGGAANSGYDKLDNGIPNFEANQYSIYATYTPAAGGSSWSIALK